MYCSIAAGGLDETAVGVDVELGGFTSNSGMYHAAVGIARLSALELRW